jgi:hypothetical protein
MLKNRKSRNKPLRRNPTPAGVRLIQSPEFSKWVHEKVEAFGKLRLIDRGERVYVSLMILAWVITGRSVDDLPTHEEIGALSRFVDKNRMELNNLAWERFGDWYLGPKPTDSKKTDAPRKWTN